MPSDLRPGADVAREWLDDPNYVFGVSDLAALIVRERNAGARAMHAAVRAIVLDARIAALDPAAVVRDATK